jgi:hypothetical protein
MFDPVVLERWNDLRFAISKDGAGFFLSGERLNAQFGKPSPT